MSILVAIGWIEFAAHLQSLFVGAQRLLVRSARGVYVTQVVEAEGEFGVSVLVVFVRVQLTLHLQSLLEVSQRLLVCSA
jgi:hypothetical protein